MTVVEDRKEPIPAWIPKFCVKIQFEIVVSVERTEFIIPESFKLPFWVKFEVEIVDDIPPFSSIMEPSAAIF